MIGFQQAFWTIIFMFAGLIFICLLNTIDIYRLQKKKKGEIRSESFMFTADLLYFLNEIGEENVIHIDIDGDRWRVIYREDVKNKDEQM